MRVYLDTCAIQRPLDDKKHAKVINESEAILKVMAAIQDSKVELAVSDVLIYETSLAVHPARRQLSEALLELGSISVKISPETTARSHYFALYEIKPMDALHLASAEAADCEFFCTCDERFLRRAREIADLQVAVVSP
jgi:predicted nucleic acid-binding protein